MFSSKKKMHRKRILGGLVVLLLISPAVALRLQQPLVVDLSSISINQSGERVYRDKAFTGEAVSYHPSGNLASAEQFFKGRRQGYSKTWFDTGQLGFETNYVQGSREGVSRSWWSNGNLRSETSYLNDKVEGVAWEWYQSGAKYKRMNYEADEPVGLQQGWRENGSLFTNFEYKNGRIYGLRKANSCVGLEDETISFEYYDAQDY